MSIPEQMQGLLKEEKLLPGISQCSLIGLTGVNLIAINSQKFIDVYLSLKLHQSRILANNNCKYSNAFFKCLYSPEIKSKVNKTLEDKKIQTHLKSENLSDEQIKEMIKFFKTLDEACENEDCNK